MFAPSRRLLAFMLGAGAFTLQPKVYLSAVVGTGQSSQQTTLKKASEGTPDVPLMEYEFQVEQGLLELANQSRQQAGAPRLVLDAGLTAAARAHAQAMLDAHELSHQFAGEPTLLLRLAAASNLQLDLAAENVALDYSAQGGHQHLMLSPPHRVNLLNPAYNVVGLGVVRSGDRLYIVQDFAHALPAYSTEEIKGRVAAALNQIRNQAARPTLPRRDLQNADQAACSMAAADKLGTARCASSPRDSPSSHTPACTPKLCPHRRPMPSAAPISATSRWGLATHAPAPTRPRPTGSY